MKKIILLLSLLIIATKIKSSMDLAYILPVAAATGISAYVFCQEENSDRKFKKYALVHHDNNTKYFARVYSIAGTGLIAAAPYFEQQTVPLVVGTAFLAVAIGTSNIRNGYIKESKNRKASQN